MTIEYYYTRQSTGFLDIEDIGNCFIDCYNDKGQEFLLWTKTSYGKTTILTQDFIEDEIEESTISIQTIPFNSLKLKNLIYSFINNFKYKITQSIEIPVEEGISKFQDLLPLMQKIETRKKD